MASINPNPVHTDTYTEPQPVDTDVGSSNPAPSLETAQVRAAKASFGLKDVLPDVDYGSLTKAIASGGEENIRKLAASRLDAMKQQQTSSKVQDLLSSWNDYPDLHNNISKSIDDVLKQGQQAIDPRSVIEEGYSHGIVDALNWAAPSAHAKELADAAKSPLEVEADKSQGFGQNFMSRREYALKLYQDLNDQANQRGYIPYLADKALGMIAVYNESRQRGNTDSSYFSNVLMGDAQEQQYQDLLAIPNDQDYKNTLDNIVGNLRSNPDQAMAWLEGLLDPSTSRRWMNNLNTVLVPTEIGGIVKGGYNIIRTIALRNQVNRAVKSAIETAINAPATRPPEVVAPAAAGDLHTASINQVVRDADELIKGVQDTQVRQGLDALMSGLKDQIQQIESDPGNMGQEGVNRLKEQYLGFIRTLMGGITNAVKVERIPGFLADKKAINLYYNKIKDLYPGLKNSILDMGNKIEWDPATNTYHVPVYIGDGDKFFDTAQQAYNYATHNGLVSAMEPALMQVNKEFGERSAALTQRINGLKQQLKDVSGPSMADLDVDAIRKELGEAEKEFDATLSWHADKLFEFSSSGEGPFKFTGNPGFYLGQQGNGFYVKFYKSLDETDSIIRNALMNPESKSIWNQLERADNTTPHGFWSDIFGWARTPEESLSAIHAANRKVAAYVPSVFMKILKESAKDLDALYSGVIKENPITGEKINFVQARINALMNGTMWSPLRSKLFGNTTRWNRFVSILDSGRYLMDKNLDDFGNPQNGYFFESPGEFERFYTNKHGVAPDPLETAAYFAFRRQYEADKIFRELVLYKNASRLGAEEHQIHYMGQNGERIESPFFAAIRQSHLPGGDDTVAIFHRNGLRTIGRGGDFTLDEKLRDAVKEGRLKVLRLFNADQRPLNGFTPEITDQRIHYAVVPTTPTTRPLSFGNMLPRRGGGHIVYDYDHYIKQAIVRPDKVGEKFNQWYEGDSTIMPIKNRAMGVKVAAHLDQVRQYLKDEDITNAKRYTEAHLPIGWDELHSWFLPQKTPDGRVIPARLGLNEPIQVVPRNKKIVDIDHSLASRYAGLFKDGTRGGSPAENLRVEFAGMRDADIAYTINDYGTPSRPLFKYEPAELVDPFVTVNRSLKQISDSYFLDDYKLYAVEHWLQEAWPHIDTAFDKNPKEEIMKSPMYYFYNGQYKPGIDFAKRSELALRRFQIKQFLGTPGVVQNFMDWASQKLADAAYNDRFYQRSILGNTVSRVPAWLVHTAPRATQKLRSAAYHAIIGTFNWAQLFAQSMNYITMAGLAGPEKSAAGGIAAMLHQYARLLGPSEEMLNTLDRIASETIPIYKPGEWKEAFQALQRTGFDTVGAEHTMLEKTYTPKIVSNGWDKFLGWGDIFFKGGERNARFGAWYIAHKEMRDEFPTGSISNFQMVKMLDRADFLAGNMSKASKSLLQTGIGEFPTQFLGYTMRVAEQMIGHRIGWKARLRTIGAFGLMFGMPQAASLTGFPADKYIRQYMLDNDYVTGENFWHDFAMNGMPAMLGAIASGAGDWKQGTQLNFGQRYGSPGLDIIREALNGDKTFKDLAAGATGSFLKSIFETSFGFRRAVLAAMTGDTDEFKIKSIDMLQPVTIFSSGNYAMRSLIAVNRGKWMSRNGTNLAQGPGQDVTKMMAIVMGLTGTQPQQVSDLDLTSDSYKNEQELLKTTAHHFTVEWHRGMDALEQGDIDGWNDFTSRAMRLLIDADYPLDQRGDLMNRAETGYNQSLITRMNDMWLLKHPPASQMDQRFERRQRINDIEQNKAQ